MWVYVQKRDGIVVMVGRGVDFIDGGVSPCVGALGALGGGCFRAEGLGIMKRRQVCRSPLSLQRTRSQYRQALPLDIEKIILFFIVQKIITTTILLSNHISETWFAYDGKKSLA